MDFPQARIQDLEYQLEDQKKLNLQYQISIKKLISDINELKIENKNLNEENKKLTDRINRYESKKSDNSQRNLNRANHDDQINGRIGEDLRQENRLLKENQELKKENEKLSRTQQELIAHLRDYQKVKKDKEFYENKYNQLFKDYNEFKSDSLKALMADPRIKNQKNKAMENEMIELKSDNEKYKLEIEKLLDQLNKKNVEESFDFHAHTKIKKEKK